MFDPSIYRERRRVLMTALPGALILFLGNDEAPMDFRANVYPFRQDGCFRYYFGLDRPALAGLIDADSGEAWLFGDDPGIDATIWLGAVEPLASLAQRVAVARTGTRGDLADRLSRAVTKGRPVLYPPPYRADTLATLAGLLGRTGAAVLAESHGALIGAVIAQREIKAPEEIAEMEVALVVTREMHHAAMALTRPGVREHHVMGRVEGLARAADLRLTYQPIFSGRGEILHNLRYDRTLSAGELVVHDAGVSSGGGYASDITRTIPVTGRFDPLQRALYDAVLRAQLQAIAASRAGARFLDIHLDAARVLAEALHDLGLFKGDVDAIVATGAYALCFQCGLGHQIGLDVHDLEALGEDHVGYDAETRRSEQFGLKSLRLGKRLKAGMTLTVEPGLYFIPQLIALWRSEGRHAGMIDYDRFEELASFGGIRIEDDILVTAEGGQVLGPPIDKTPEQVEERMASQLI
ncbi:MAG: aminopeptidase P family protein [Pseudomonadota bacterium]